jgi:hypothetical protein
MAEWAEFSKQPMDHWSIEQRCTVPDMNEANKKRQKIIFFFDLLQQSLKQSSSAKTFPNGGRNGTSRNIGKKYFW